MDVTVSDFEENLFQNSCPVVYRQTDPLIDLKSEIFMMLYSVLFYLYTLTFCWIV